MPYICELGCRWIYGEFIEPETACCGSFYCFCQLWRCAVLYEGISRPRRLATLTIFILLAMASLGIVLIVSPFLVLIMTRLLYISSRQPKRKPPGSDYYYYNSYQHHRSRFDCSTGVIFSKIHKTSRFGT